jgi:cell wall integrity and stress response component
MEEPEAVTVTVVGSSVSLQTNSGGQVKTVTVAATSETAGADSASATTES